MTHVFMVYPIVTSLIPSPSSSFYTLVVGNGSSDELLEELQEINLQEYSPEGKLPFYLNSQS